MSGVRKWDVVLGGLILLLGIGVIAAPASLAGPVPKGFLHSGDDRQRGHNTHFTSGRRAGKGECSILHGDGFYDWPRAMRHKSHKRLRIGFRRDDKPVEVFLRDYRKVSDEGYGQGKHRRVPFKLRPRREGDEVVGWRVLFKRRALGHHYLTASVRWEGEHRCEFDEAPYDFHIRTVSG